VFMIVGVGWELCRNLTPSDGMGSPNNRQFWDRAGSDFKVAQ
jgi:hypothetical protein